MKSLEEQTVDNVAAHVAATLGAGVPVRTWMSEDLGDLERLMNMPGPFAVIRPDSVRVVPIASDSHGFFYEFSLVVILADRTGGATRNEVNADRPGLPGLRNMREELAGSLFGKVFNVTVGSASIPCPSVSVVDLPREATVGRTGDGMPVIVSNPVTLTVQTPRLHAA